MQIVKDNPVPNTLYGSLDDGDVYQYEDTILIKGTAGGKDWRCVGSLVVCGLYAGTKVIYYPNAKLVLGKQYNGISE